jgi:hypothetical protein
VSADNNAKRVNRGDKTAAEFLVFMQKTIQPIERNQFEAALEQAKQLAAEIGRGQYRGPCTAFRSVSRIT